MGSSGVAVASEAVGSVASQLRSGTVDVGVTTVDGRESPGGPCRYTVLRLHHEHCTTSEGNCRSWASACCAAADWAPSATSPTVTPSWLPGRPASTCA